MAMSCSADHERLKGYKAHHIGKNTVTCLRLAFMKVL